MSDDNGFLIEQENALLGVLLTTPEQPGLRKEIAGIVNDDDFSPRGKVIWRAIMAQDGKAVNQLTVTDFLMDKGEKWLERAGGESFLQNLALAGIDDWYGMAPEYAKALAECGQQRRKKKLAEQAAKLLLADDINGVRALLNQQTEKAGEAPSWEWRTLANAYEPKPPRQWLVNGLLPIPSVSTFYGTPGGLKTMLAQDLAACVAGGVPWLAALPGDEKAQPFQVMQAPVLWVDVDNGLDRTERRFAALGRGHDLPGDTALAFVSFPTPPFFANETESVDLVLEAIGRTGACLVVIDNLGSVSGGSDENSAEMIAVMSGLRRIAELGGCAVVVIHHKSKGGRERAGDSLRGHSSIEAAVDLALMVERDGGEDTVTLKSTKTRDTPVAPFTAMWTYEQDAAGELVRGRFFGMGRPENEAMTKQQQAELCITMDMTDGANQSQLVELCKAAGIGRSTALAAIGSLVESGKMTARPGGAKNALLYYRSGSVV
jgi:hypothetical protein